MELSELLKTKEKELEVLNNENRKVEQYRLDILSQIIKVTGQIELLKQLINMQTSETATTDTKTQ